MIKNIQLADCFQAGGVRLERVKYFQRQLLTVDDMVTDQDYFRQKMRRHNRFLHGWGVVCGLVVTAAPTTAQPWLVRISEGYALGPYGDEIYVPAPAFFDLAACGPNDRSDPCDPGRVAGTRGTGGTVYVAIEYAECFSQPIQAMPAGCGCNDDGCEYSRVRDSFDFTCLADKPVYDPLPPICDLIARKVPAPCPPCPSSPWVVLAAVNLPSAKNTMLANDAIDLSIRKNLYRTELLQAQIIRCCCGQGPAPVPVKVVTPAPGTTQTFPFTNQPASLVLTLSKSVNPSTVNANSVTVTGSNGAAVQGTVLYTDSNRTITFTPGPTTGGVAGGTGRFLPDTYQVGVKGSGASAVIDVDGLALDGNGDGTGGDNYTSTLVITKPVG